MRSATFSAFDTHFGRSAGIRFARLASGTRIAWAASGRGPPLVRVAHWMTHVEQDLQSPLWRPWRSRLNQSVQLVRYDERGTGASIAAVESITLANLVNDVFAVLDAHGIERCVLAAESSGALTALSAALQPPQRISGWVIVDGMVFRGLDSATGPFLKGLQHAYPATLDRFVDLCMPDEGPAHIKRWGRQIIDGAAPEAAIALRRLNSEADLRADLPKIRQPTLIIHCEGDKIMPVEQARTLAKTLPNAELVILKDSGHIPTMTRPAEIAAQSERFFA